MYQHGHGVPGRYCTPGIYRTRLEGSQRKEEVRRKETLKEEERKNSAIIRYLKNWEGEIEGDGSQKASKKRARSGKESKEETRIKGSKANDKAAKRSVRGKECGS